MSIVAQRLKELQESTNRYYSNQRTSTEILAPEIRGILNQRKNALLQKHHFMDGNVIVTKNVNTTKEKTENILDSRKHALVEADFSLLTAFYYSRLFAILISTERWRERIKIDPDLEFLGGIRRLPKNCSVRQIRSKSLAMDIGKGLDRFYPTASTFSPPSKILQIDAGELDDVTASTPRLVIPIRAAARGRSRRIASRRSTESPAQKIVLNPPDTPLPIEYEFKQADKDENDGGGIASSAKKGLQSKLDYSAVKLKKPELKSVYPKLMLIRLKGDKNIDVRLVAPKYTSVHACAVFILVTPNKLFLYHGKHSRLLERSKATIIATGICEKTGELGCSAKQYQNVREGEDVDEFWNLLGLKEGISREEIEESIPENLLLPSDLFENVAAQLNTIYEVDDDCSLRHISKAEIPKYSMLHSKKNLIFDFGSEIYVWVGRNANRIGTQQAIAYAEELRTKPLTVDAMESRMILGDNFNFTRPEWCLLVKLTQGLNDLLFQHKFHDWEISTPRSCGTPRRWKTTVLSTPTSPQREHEDARNLGRSLASRKPEESILILEETELFRDANNIFTENIRYFILVGEKTLRELNDLWLFHDHCCYVIKWEYRIERVGVRKLDGTIREKETGRPRVAYFYWLGANSTKTDQGLCALALRDYDTERYPHERIVQGQEPPLFLQLFNGKMTVCGTGSGIFLIYGSSISSESHMEELTTPVVYRSHAVYIVLKSKSITILEGTDSSENSRKAASKFAENIKKNYTVFEQFTSEPIIEHCSLTESKDCAVIAADQWIQAPRLFRLFEKDAEELFCPNFDPKLPFSFRQEHFRDSIMVDQGNKLWLWSDNTISTFALRVADAYWSERSGSRTVICKTLEPNSFKALFPKWDEYVDESNENESAKHAPLRCKPVDLDELLKLRTRTWPLEKVIKRELPPGSDLNRLEQYLDDGDFKSVFEMDRTAFYALPRWKQIELRKKHKLF